MRFAGVRPPPTNPQSVITPAPGFPKPPVVPASPPPPRPPPPPPPAPAVPDFVPVIDPPCEWWSCPVCETDGACDNATRVIYPPPDPTNATGGLHKGAHAVATGGPGKTQLWLLSTTPGATPPPAQTGPALLQGSASLPPIITSPLVAVSQQDNETGGALVQSLCCEDYSAPYNQTHAKRVAVDGRGVVWLVNHGGSLHSLAPPYEGVVPEPRLNGTQDVACGGPDYSSVWAAGADPFTLGGGGGGPLRRKRESGPLDLNVWDPPLFFTRAKRVAVDGNDTVWYVDPVGDVWQLPPPFEEDDLVKVGANASDIAACGAGVWIVDNDNVTESNSEGGQLRRYTGDGTWDDVRTDVRATGVACDSRGGVYYTDCSKRLWYLNTAIPATPWTGSLDGFCGEEIPVEGDDGGASTPPTSPPGSGSPPPTSPSGGSSPPPTSPSYGGSSPPPTSPSGGSSSPPSSPSGSGGPSSQPSPSRDDWCAPGCPPHYIADGFCDWECQRPACGNYDRVDCQTAPECAPGCPVSWTYDLVCQEACNVASCNFDAGDGWDPCNDQYACQVGCKWNWPGDHWCDPECYNADCDWDGGDCDFCSPGCQKRWLGDGECDDLCNNKDCGWDANDCERPSPPPDDSQGPECSPGCTYEKLKDWVCQDECNTYECAWDNGYCALPDCAPGCTADLLKNDVCDPACDVAPCAYDNGACLCAPGCLPEYVRDAQCHPECDNEACTWDNYVCVGGCAPGCAPGWETDDVCDSVCNTEVCGWDAGKCEDTVECDQYTDCAACSASPGCGWWAKGARCERGCPVDGSECYTDFNAASCPTPCKDYTDCLACAATDDCVWYDGACASGPCSPDQIGCQATPESCTADANQCGDYTTCVDCLPWNGCVWYDGQCWEDTCEGKSDFPCYDTACPAPVCGDYKTCDACAPWDGCVWWNGQCQQDTCDGKDECYSGDDICPAPVCGDYKSCGQCTPWDGCVWWNGQCQQDTCDGKDDCYSGDDICPAPVCGDYKTCDACAPWDGCVWWNGQCQQDTCDGTARMTATLARAPARRLPSVRRPRHVLIAPLLAAACGTRASASWTRAKARISAFAAGNALIHLLRKGEGQGPPHQTFWVCLTAPRQSQSLKKSPKKNLSKHRPLPRRSPKPNRRRSPKKSLSRNRPRLRPIQTQRSPTSRP